MTAPRAFSALCGLILTLSAPWAVARLGETEVQSQTRYGAPVPELIGADEKPLIEGTKELAYSYQGWRIRVAFLNNVAAKLEYAHLPEAGQLKQLTDQEIQTILEAEKGTFRWREQKPRTGNAGLDALATMFERQWERSDHATAKLKAKLALVIEGREVEAFEKKRAKQGSKGATPKPTVPKF